MDEVIQLSFPFIAFFLNLVAQVVGIIFLKRSIVVSLFLGYAAGLLALLVMTWGALGFFGAPDIYYLALTNFGIYSAVSYCYFHYINIGEASVRIRLLAELAKVENLSEKAIRSEYNASRIVDIRLERLLASGQVFEKGGRYFNGKPRMLHVARVFRVLKICVLGKAPKIEF